MVAIGTGELRFAGPTLRPQMRRSALPGPLPRPQAPEERQNLAHGVSRGSADTPHTPALSPAGRGGTAKRWVRALSPGLTPWAKVFCPCRG